MDFFKKTWVEIVAFVYAYNFNRNAGTWWIHKS